ncbi:MAG: multiheme c-type cytochrome [Candidatus Scalindua sp.]
MSIKSFPLVFGMVVLVVIVVMSAGCELYQKISMKMNLEPELVKRGEDSPDSKKCGDCHNDIYEEWTNSRHAKSYTNEEFKMSTNDYEFKFCLGCHIPETIFTTGVTDTSSEGYVKKEIKPRSHNLDEGVNCHSCHLTTDCILAGPHSGMGPHPIEKKEEFYRTSDFCGRCHIDIFKEYMMYAVNGKEKTCQDCHMPAIKRKLIQVEPWQKIHIRREGKAHTFSSSDALKNNKDFIELTFTELKENEEQIKGNVEILNSKVNHSIPTGKYGYREVLLLINLKDNFGRVIKSRQESMFIDMGTQLKPGEKKIYSFEFDIDNENGVKELEAVLFKTNFNRTKKTLLAKVELGLGTPQKD